MIAYEAAGHEFARADQLSCGGLDEMLGVPAPRLIVNGTEISPGCHG
ncbi:MAG TPA: hypothetical protein PLV68_09975 [Ilumatobacteraceae bacterium]|nr:hypothetical protein [Ilumatobacteraceae bacterium]